MALLVLWACDEAGPPPAGRAPREDFCADSGDGWKCDGSDAVRCSDGVTEKREDCAIDDALCVSGQGCLDCVPHTTSCDGNELSRCRSDGRGKLLLETCDDDQQCTLGGCANLCKRAAEDRSYIGCEYWPVTTANSSLDTAFEPALAVGNPNLQEAEVVLSKGGITMTVHVPPGGMEVVPLPFDEQLRVPFVLDPGEDGVRGTRDDFVDTSQPRSMLVAGGAYRLVSNIPVTVHQFNPLEFEVETCDAWGESDEDERGCFSETNDASLLLPTTALTGSYSVITRPTLPVTLGEDVETPQAQIPGFVAVIGTQPEPTHVEVRVSAHVAADPGGSGFEALAPGDVLEVELSRGDVLQLASGALLGDCPGREVEDEFRPRTYCDAGADYDLTGTEIQADAPVSVIAGHDCAHVPFDRVACDHLEESMFPMESWGTHHVATRPARDDSEAYRIKVLSATDGNRITVDPPLPEDLVLDRGESFEWQTKHHLVVTGSAPIAVAQFLLGQGASKEVGDPSMSLAIPSDQYKREYDILTPDTYDEVYVNLVITRGQLVRLDGQLLGGALAVDIGDSGYSVIRQRVGGGLHHIEGAGKVGVVVYGFAAYTSYMVPGGLDLTLLHPPPF